MNKISVLKIEAKQSSDPCFILKKLLSKKSNVCRKYMKLNLPRTVKHIVSKVLIKHNAYKPFIKNKVAEPLDVPKYTYQRICGSVVECLTQDRGAAGSCLTSVTALRSLSKTHLS